MNTEKSTRKVAHSLCSCRVPHDLAKSIFSIAGFGSVVVVSTSALLVSWESKRTWPNTLPYICADPVESLIQSYPSILEHRSFQEERDEVLELITTEPNS